MTYIPRLVFNIQSNVNAIYTQLYYLESDKKEKQNHDAVLAGTVSANPFHPLLVQSPSLEPAQLKPSSKGKD